jgi:ParB-like chromosome segregation protein Spo0J
MPDTQAPGLPAPALFDVTTIEPSDPAGTLVRVPLDEIELAPNARREIAQESIERLAHMLMTMGQLVPCIGHRPADAKVVLYAGQRRLLAARASAELAGDGTAPVRSLIVLLVDHEPSGDEVRRIQAQENQREDLTLSDQQAQFAECWAARAGLADSDRIAAVCSDLGIGPVKAHNLRRQLTLPEPIRARVAERPSERQLSVTLANRLADMHDVAPELTEAVAQRVSSPNLHEAALRDLGAFVHRTIVEDPGTYAVRIDDGALLDAHAQIALAREHLTPHGRDQLVNVLACAPDELDAELDALRAKASRSGAQLRVDAALRERARTGRFAFVHDRGADFAAGIWVVDPAFMLDAVHQALAEHDATAPAADPAYFAGAGLDAPDLREAAADERARRHEHQQRRADAVRTNLGLGHDLRAGLIDPSPAQLDALRAIVCHLLARDYRDVIAFGAGWTDPERQRPVGESGRHEPMAIDAIVGAELRRALDEPDPLRGIASLVARCAAAFVLDPDGVTRTKVLGSERMGRKLHEALPGGEEPLRAALWTFLRPMLSPRLGELHRDAFVIDDAERSTVDLTAHRGDSALDDLDLGVDG